MSRGLLVRWGSGGLNTDYLLVLILKTPGALSVLKTLSGCPLVLFCPKNGELFSYVLKSQNHSYVLKKISYVFKQSLCMSCISSADSAIKKENKKGIRKKRMIKKERIKKR